MSDMLCSSQFRENLRVVHRELVHEDVHVHVLPVLQVPPFEQTGEQTAKKIKNRMSRNSFFFRVRDL